MFMVYVVISCSKSGCLQLLGCPLSRRHLVEKLQQNTSDTILDKKNLQRTCTGSHFLEVPRYLAFRAVVFRGLEVIRVPKKRGSHKIPYMARKLSFVVQKVYVPQPRLASKQALSRRFSCFLVKMDIYTPTPPPPTTTTTSSNIASIF